MTKTRTDLIPKLPKSAMLPEPNKTDPTQPNFQLSQPFIPQTPQTPQVAPAPPAPQDTGPKVYKNEQGNPSGIEINGKTYLGLSPSDVASMAQADAGKNKYNPNYQPAVEQGFAAQQMQAQQQQVQAQQQAQMQQQQLMQQLAGSAGIQGMQQDINGNYVDAKGAPIDWTQVGLSTAADKGAWATIGGLAGAGAVLGGTAGLGFGAVPGAIGGALLGIGVSILGNIKQQKGENIGGYKSELTDGQKYLNQLTLLVQAHPENAQNYIDGFNLQMDKIEEAHAKLYAEATSNLNAVVEQDATRELARFDNFYSPNGGRDILKMKMQNAIMAPNAQNALAELAISQQSIGDEEGL